MRYFYLTLFLTLLFLFILSLSSLSFLPLSDEDLHPQFLSSATPGAATVRSSARTYFYHDEHKCDENMENFIKCIKVAGTK